MNSASRLTGYRIPVFERGGRVTIRLNGERHELDAPLSVQALLERLGIDLRRVAVERNVTIVKRSAFESTIVAEGDEIEIVNFVGGG